MITVNAVESYLFQVAPKDLQQSWDNVGLLVGDPEEPVRSVLVALDITRDVVDEAVGGSFDLIVAHHPVMNCAWHPVQSVRTDTEQGYLLSTMLRRGISAICMHTNLDAVQGGVNDALADALSLRDTAPLGEDGIGRVGILGEELPLRDFAARVKDVLHANGVRFADGGKIVRRVAVGGGACGDCAAQAAALGCDTFVTSDLKYHDFQNAAPMGLNLIDAGHFPTEDVICPVLVNLLRERFPALRVEKSLRHGEIIQYI